MLNRRSAGARSKVLFLFSLLAVIPARASFGALQNPFEEVAAAEIARLDALTGKPEAVAPLLALFGLADVLPPGRLDAVVTRLLRPDLLPSTIVPGQEDSASYLERASAGGLCPPERGGVRGGASGSEPPPCSLRKPGAADPLVAARARDWLARRLEQQGDDGAAASVREPLGILSRFWVVGPFGDGRASVDVPYPPEFETGVPDAARDYAGKERKVGWRRAEGAIHRGTLDLSALIRPDSQAAAYALAFVHVERPTRAGLRIGTPGPVKVWCNGRLIHAADRVRSARLDQDAVGVDLGRGWNRLLIKTVVTEGAWRVYARLTEPDGGRLSFANDWTPSESSSPSPSPLRQSGGGDGQEGPSRIPVRALEPILRERVRAARSAISAAQAELDLGRYLLMVDSADRDQKEAAHAFEISADRHPTADALMGLSNAAREEDESRRALERALVVAKVPRERAAVLSALGDVARDQHRESQAVERWRAALAADPRWWPAVLSLAGEEQTAGFPAAALMHVDDLPAEIRALPAVGRERVRLLMALDRRNEAESIRRALLSEARDDVDLLRDLASTARLRGDAAESIRLLESAALHRPDLSSLTVEWARALEGARDRDGARAVLESAARRLPDEPVLAAELGKLLDRMGESPRALGWLRVALGLRPQDPDLRRYAEALTERIATASPPVPALPAVGETGKAPVTLGASGRTDLGRRFAAAVPPLLAFAGSAAAPPAAAEPDPAIVLLDRRAVRVHPNGLSEVFAQRVVEVRTDIGAQDNKEFYVRYTPGSEEVEILEARIFRRGPGGAIDVFQASDRDDRDLSEPWYGLYYDYRAEVVRFEGLRAGDVLEIQYVLTDVSRENQLAGYFGDLQFVAETIPKRQWDYTLLAPPGRDFYFARPVLSGLKESSSDEEGEHVTRFAARDVPRIEVEPAMPGIGEVSPYLHISTYKSWDDVGKWYWRLVEEQLVPDDTIRSAAESAIRSAEAASRVRGSPERGGLTDLEKVRALHNLVLRGTRYVGLEFGIHGFKPYKVSQVLARKFGDCKDKAALLTALLSQAGVDAEMVLLRTRRGGRIAPSPASLAVFDHAIVYVPKLGLYLDGTAEFSGMKELPNQDQGVMVLRIGAHGTKLVETPVLPSADNNAVRSWTVRLKADGDAEVAEHLSIDGQAAPEWRSHYQTAGERMDRYAKVWSGRNPGARLESVEMSGIDDRNRPVTVDAKALVPRMAERTSNGGLSLMVGARDGDLVRTYARLSGRRSDLVLAYPWRHQEVITYQLPPGHVATSLPRSRTLETRFGHFDLRIEASAHGTVVSEARLVVERDRVAPVDYAAFRAFLADVDAAMAERIVVEPARHRAVSTVPGEAVTVPVGLGMTR